MAELRRVCVFWGSSTGTLPSFAAAAVSRARRWPSDRWSGPGLRSVGLIGLIADAALVAGGQVIGVITEPLVDHEIAHGGLVRLDVVRNDAREKNPHGRTLRRLRHVARGLRYLQGVREAVTWRQLDIHGKPSGILNVDGYFADLLAFVAHAVEMGFIRPHNAAQIAIANDPETLLDTLAAESHLA